MGPVDGGSWHRHLHHDGSARYVSNSAPALGEDIELFLEVSPDIAVDRVFVRTVADGEPVFTEARRISGGWTSKLHIRNVRAHYRWLLVGGDAGYLWLNAAGITPYDCPDSSDFAVVAMPSTPAWLSQSVVYQVFPDRFARSAHVTSTPDWAVPRQWETKPEGRSSVTGVEFYGGDIWGIADKLDYLSDLGVNVIYMTPIFPARSNHRYDAQTFDCVDPVLGGDEALRNLIDRAHERQMRVVGDITLNHCGVSHEWFIKAQQGQEPYRSFFTFDESLPHGYECWWGVPSLPKFNWTSRELQRALVTDEESVLRKWLRFGLDGWRVDVANMSGRQGALDMTHEIARMARTAVALEGADKALIAEHFHDSGTDLAGDGWQGGMNYSAFTRPVWAWLVSPSFVGSWLGASIPIPKYSSADMVNSMTAFASSMPWRSYVASWPLLGSHDTARIRSVVGSAERQQAAVAMLMTLPGTPMIFAGDEIGAEGLWGEDSRTTFPWDDTLLWDHTTLRTYKDLIALRRNEVALGVGGLKWRAVERDVVAYQRDDLLVVVARSESPSIDLGSLDVGEQLFGTMTLSQGVVGNIRAGASIWRIAS